MKEITILCFNKQISRDMLFNFKKKMLVKIFCHVEKNLKKTLNF